MRLATGACVDDVDQGACVHAIICARMHTVRRSGGHRGCLCRRRRRGCCRRPRPASPAPAARAALPEGIRSASALGRERHDNQRRQLCRRPVPLLSRLMRGEFAPQQAQPRPIGQTHPLWHPIRFKLHVFNTTHGRRCSTAPAVRPVEPGPGPRPGRGPPRRRVALRQFMSVRSPVASPRRSESFSSTSDPADSH